MWFVVLDVVTTDDHLKTMQQILAFQNLVYSAAVFVETIPNLKPSSRSAPMVVGTGS